MTFLRNWGLLLLTVCISAAALDLNWKLDKRKVLEEEQRVQAAYEPASFNPDDYKVETGWPFSGKKYVKVSGYMDGLCIDCQDLSQDGKQRQVILTLVSARGAGTKKLAVLGIRPMLQANPSADEKLLKSHTGEQVEIYGRVEGFHPFGNGFAEKFVRLELHYIKWNGKLYKLRGLYG